MSAIERLEEKPERDVATRKEAWDAGAEGQNRTVDTGIFSAVLYQLSYLGE